MSTFLITGGAGFIGRHLGRELIDAGHRVRVLDSLVEQAHGPADVPGPEVEFVRGDVRDPDALAKALLGVDGVFHLAAEVGVGQSMYEIERYVSANSLGTAVLMQELVKRRVRRVVVASSMSLYGEGRYLDAEGSPVEGARRSPAGLRERCWDPVGESGELLVPAPTDELKRPDVTSVYALTKYDQEQLVLILAAAYGIEAVALRLFNVFGPGQMLSNPYTGVLAIFAGRLINGQAPLVFEDGRQKRDFVHVADVAHAFRLAMEQPGIDGEVFNIGSGQSYTVEYVATLLAEAMNRDLQPTLLGKARAGDIRHCFADITKARLQLGYEPTRTLQDSVDEVVSWVSGQRPQDRVVQAHGELVERGLVA
jgi:dTDP-L-rhamnose 4-epimerase